MAVFTKTYTFTAGSKVKASEANQNFNDISNFLNNSVIHVDASKAFTGVPLGPSTDPTVDDHLARKKYVDDKSTTLANADALRPQFVYGISGLSGTPSSPTQMKLACGTYSGTTNEFGCINVPISGLSNVATVMVCNGDTLNTNALSMSVRAIIPSQVTVQVHHVAISATQVLTYNSNPVRVNWIAVGW